MDEKEFWDWLGSYAVRCAQTNKFGHIHPFIVRKHAGEAFGFDYKNVPATWNWQKAHAAKIKRTVNAAVKPLGFRVAKRATGYMRLERVTPTGLNKSSRVSSKRTH